MASGGARAAHVQDTSVLERRLRPIYEWLDAANYRKAIQECDKVLKKSAQLARVQALKALALLRMGKDADSTLLLDGIATLQPTDDATLQVMSMCYREMHQMERVCQLYEEAVRVDGGNEELHTHLFMAYVRTDNFKAQQQAAMTLYKLQPKKPYYCWAIMSIILQAQRGEGARDAKKRHLLLTLAERMIDKVLAEGSVAAEPVVLYVMVLDALGKHAQIMDVLAGPLGATLAGEMALDATPYRIKLQRWAAINCECKRQLRATMDRWDVWLLYMDSLFALQRTPSSDKHANESPDCSVAHATAFISALIEQQSEGYVLRGPYLARFELLKRQTDGDTIELADMFAEYFARFGHKSCCVGDLRDYLHLLPIEARASLAARLVRAVGVTATSVPSSERQMQQHVGALQMARLCGAHAALSDAHALALVTALAFYYAHGRSTYGVLRTEPHTADAYILLAAHTLHDVFVRRRSARPLLVALVLLRHALAHSPHNSHVQLAMVRILHVLGAVAAANAVFEALDVKHLQLDSMCHVHTAHVPASGHFALAHQLCDSTLKFFASNYRDSSEHLTYAYKFGSFRKLTEFMDFRERMHNSYHYTSVAVDKMFLLVVQAATVDAIRALEVMPRDHPIEWESMRNNSDLSVYASWDPQRINAPLETWPQNSAIYAQNVALLRMRVELLACINCALQLCRLRPNDQPPDFGDALRRLEAWREGDDVMREVRQDTLAVSAPSLLRVYRRMAYHTIATHALRIVSAMERDDVEMALKAVARTASALVAAGECVLGRLEGAAANGRADDRFVHNRSDLQFACNFIEIVAVVTLALVVSADVSRRHWAHARKQRKQLACDGRLREPLAGLVSSVREQVRRVDGALDVLVAPSVAGAVCDEDDGVQELIGKLATLHIGGAQEEEVLGELRASNERAVKEMRAVLRAKLKLLAGVSWAAGSS